MTPKETLRQWCDYGDHNAYCSHFAGIVPTEMREAGLAVLAQLDDARAESERLRGMWAEWNRAAVDKEDDTMARLHAIEAALVRAERERAAAIAERDEAIADSHCLLSEAYAAVDPETWPDLSAKLSKALDGCPPQCHHLLVVEQQRDAAEAKLARVRDWLKHEANSPGGIVAEIDALFADQEKP